MVWKEGLQIEQKILQYEKLSKSDFRDLTDMAQVTFEDGGFGLDGFV